MDIKKKIIRKIKNIVKEFFERYGFAIIRTNKDDGSDSIFIGSEFSFLHGIVVGRFFSSLKYYNKHLLIIQIGANDGKTVDPVFNFVKHAFIPAKLLLIEPQPDLIHKLESNYSWNNDKIILNAAIGEKENNILYRIRPEYHKKYHGIIASGISSFDKDYVVNKAIKNLPKKIIKKIQDENELIEALEINSLTIFELFEKYNIKTKEEFIWMQIDTEGWDDKIIYQIPMDKILPAIISFEISHFSEQRLTTLLSYLKDKNYNIIQVTNDSMCAVLYD